MAHLTDIQLIDRVYGHYTKGSRERLQAMIDACRRIDECQLQGDIVECGVWRGGHIILARLISPSRVCWLYDTFSGMPKPGKRDVKVGDKGRSALQTWKAKSRDGNRWAASSREEVEKYMLREGVYDEVYLRFVVGDVALTLRGPIGPERIALLRLDTDWYDSTRTELEVLYPRLVSGGVLIVDDYGHWRGSRDACQEYFKKKGIQYNVLLKPIDKTAVMMVKP